MASLAELNAVVDVLKKRFASLTATETINLAFDILEALERVQKAVTA